MKASPRAVNLGLALAALAVLASVAWMAVASPLNAHPDERHHVDAGRYFLRYWDFPARDDPRVMETLSKYGLSYLQQLDVVYFFAGKFAAGLGVLGVPDHIALRFFNVALLAVLLGLAFRLPGWKKLAFLPLFLSPQVWYVFSYCNGDAFPLFLAFVMVFLVARSGFPWEATPAEEAGPGRLAGLGLCLGLICVSKQNYYIWAVFFAAFLGLCGYQTGRLGAVARKAAVIFVLAGLIFAGRYALDAHVNRNADPDAVARYAEQFADPAYKPSAGQNGTRFWGLHLRDQGKSYFHIFAKGWLRDCYCSSFGTYGYMKIYGNTAYYLAIGLACLGLLIVLSRAVAARGGPDGRAAVWLFFGFAVLTVFQSTWNSWVVDFQAQGRYLFPIGPMAGLTLARFAGAVGAAPRRPLLLAGAMFFLSLLSFLCVAIATLCP